MYSLDVNFLNDRVLVPGPSTQAKAAPAKPVPMLLGLAVGLVPLAGVGILWFVLQNQTAQLQEEQAKWQAALEQGKAKEAELKSINDQIVAVNNETNALATVFDQIDPWSAILQDIRNRIPPGVQIRSVQQSDPDPTTTAAAAPASPDPNNPQPAAVLPTSRVEISGFARSFSEVNDFLLLLKRSRLLQGDKTQLVSAAWVENPIQLELPENRQNVELEVKLPKVVEYKIQTNLSDASASELLREWERNGAVGLATRLRTLQNKGVIQR